MGGLTPYGSAPEGDAGERDAARPRRPLREPWGIWPGPPRAAEQERPSFVSTSGPAIKNSRRRAPRGLVTGEKTGAGCAPQLLGWDHAGRSIRPSITVNRLEQTRERDRL